MQNILAKHSNRVIAHSVGLALLIVALGFLSLTKGWLALLFIPLLLAFVPFLLTTQIWTHVRSYRHGASVQLRKLAIWQVVLLFMAFLAAPGVYDTNDTMIFGIFQTGNDALLTGTTSIFTLVALLGFITITTWQFVILIKTRKRQK